MARTSLGQLNEYSPDFFDDVKSRGREYFRRRAVRILEATPTTVTATVQGSEAYRVLVEWAPEEGPAYECTCPFFHDRDEPCKHCWATVLQANAEGVLPGPDGEPGAGDEGDRKGAVERDRNGDGNGDGDYDDEEYEDDPPPQRVTTRPPSGYGIPAKPAKVDKSDPTAWKKQLKKLTEPVNARSGYGGAGASYGAYGPTPLSWPPGRRIVYVIDKPSTLERGLTIELCHESPRKDGSYDRPKQLKIAREQVASLPDETDAQIVQMLLGARRGDYGYYGYYEAEAPRKFELPESAYATTLRLMLKTGRCRLREVQGQDYPRPLEWDEGGDWEFWLEVKTSPGGRYYLLDASFRRGEERRHVAEPQLLVRGGGGAGAHGLIFLDGKVARLLHFDAFDLIAGLRDGMKLSVPLDQREELMNTLFSLRALPKLELPEDLRVQETRPTPKPRLTVKKPAKATYDDRLIGSVSFDYDGQVIDEKTDAQVVLAAAPTPAVAAVPGNASEGNPPQPQAGESAGAEAAPETPAPDESAQPRRVIYRDRAEAAPEAPAPDESAQPRRVIYRDRAREAEATARLIALGFRDSWEYAEYGSGGQDRQVLRLPAAKLPKVVSELTREGWFVEAEGKLYRQPGEFKVAVRSGIDWFELHGEVSFGEQTASLPKLLAALRKGETTVRLDDGSFGLLPQDWLKKYAPLVGLGQGGEDTDEDALRFTKRQIGFLDALLSGMPEARFDETFTRARDELMRFEGIKPLDPPETFSGVLRAYQRDGLGWMSFLRRFSFGGCLADDMGLGKTIQVLALLEERRRLRLAQQSSNGNGRPSHAPTSPHPHAPTLDLPSGPSLVVAPRSLIFNWKQEAAKFTPQLRVLDQTSADRQRSGEQFGEYDLILTTYGTLRRDMGYFKDVRFDYAVLDEAQAIKNASSESAKAARLIQADHRLALSGTPVQNHLGELWSLFEFLNPGMMGSASVFKDVTAATAGQDREARGVLSKALRPFILRRTKEQVAKDLPEKTEQTLFCVLDTAQRKLYDELRDHYRTNLLERIAREGINKAKIQVLEALLRLRQAACHPGLIDKARSKEGSAKVDTLLEQVAEVLDEGHKVLVFSQFTSLLAIVREKLDATNTVYEYLDGRTKDRQERVERFQNDESCKLFLISLKAGGLGLNLTAAEYVFLLDPWWNPAVEAQAIDRAHRIGQTKNVFAYRLIAKDTVEEKVLQLQQTKKDLADAIINADNSLIRTLKKDDLELLLS